VLIAGKAKANNSSDKRRSTQSAGIKSPKQMALPLLSATRQTPTKKFLSEECKGSSAIEKVNWRKCKKTHRRAETRERKCTGVGERQRRESKMNKNSFSGF
jgi:hypothetical protein